MEVKWIRVDVGLPKRYQPVWLFDGSKVFMGYCCSNGWFKVLPVKNITHWANIPEPEPPKEDK